MFIIKLGIRNLFRHKKRTVITSVLISLAILIFLTVQSLMGGMTELSYNNIIDLESGHLQITKPAYWEEREELSLENLMTVSDEFKSEIKDIENYQGMAEQLKFSARLNNGIDELPITAVGIRVDQYKDVFKTGNYFIEGDFFKTGERKAVLGQSLAELMGLSLGDYITLVTRTQDGTFNTIDLEIAGLLKTPNPTINDSTVYLPLEIAQNSLNAEGQISQLIIRLDGSKEQALSIEEDLNQQIAGLDDDLQAYTWRESASIVVAMSEAQSVETTTVLGIILLIASVGIVNTTILSGLERMEEIGMMKALGMRENEIIRAFMVEAAGIGVVGGLIGWLLSIAGVYYLAEVGIAFSQLAGEEMSFGMPILDKIYGTWDFTSFIFIFIFGVIVAVLASILPARWAARKDPIKAIYHKK
ncbi:MAG: ABC transporter permease [Halanaerobiales bacterium]